MESFEESLFYQKVDIRSFPSTLPSSRLDGAYWKRFRIQTAQQTGAVSNLSFAPEFPHKLAATGGTRVVLYDAEPLRTTQALSKFSDLAHGGSFRQDGRLLVAGTEEGLVKVFNVGDRSILRQFDGHKRPVHVAQFSRSQSQVLSGSDDATVRLWELSEARQICRLDGHRDYVRAGRQSPAAMDIWATGGYDHVCRLWDVRQRTAALEFDHGAPIESVTFLPSGTLLVTAGGPFLCIWDVLSTGRLLRKLETHHKTITAVDVIQTEDTKITGPRLVSASLDQHVKFYDLTEFTVLHDSRYKHPILSFASTPDGRSYAVGMPNGTIVVRDNRHKRPVPEETQREEASAPNTIHQKKPKLSGFNNLLRKFRYKDALDLVLKEPDIRTVSAVVEELAARDGLVPALMGRSADDLHSLLSYINSHLGNPVFADHVTPLLEILLDLYDAELAVKPLDKKLNNILQSIRRELSLLVEMKELKGSIEAVLCTK